MIPIEIITELLLAINKTNSPRNKLDLIKNFIILYFKDCDEENKLKLLNSYQEQMDEKSLQGKESIKKRIYKKKSKKICNHYMFVKDYKSGQKCSGCNEKIISNIAFRRWTGEEYDDRHATPSCFPENYKKEMLNNKNYIKFIEIKNDTSKS